MSRNKGAAWERQVANELKPYFPNARRGLGQARSAGEVSDVEGTPWWVECKRMKRCSIEAAWRQAEAATDGRPILVVTRDDRAEALATLMMPTGRRLILPWVLLLETLAQGWRPSSSSPLPSLELPASTTMTTSERSPEPSAE
jgi:hypothetical protein